MLYGSSYKRANLVGYGSINNKIKFQIIDISASGAKIHSEKVLNLNEVIHLKFTLRGHFYNKNISVNACVIRFSNEDGKNVYGVHFVNLSKNDAIEIDEIIHVYCSESRKLYK